MVAPMAVSEASATTVMFGGVIIDVSFCKSDEKTGRQVLLDGRSKPRDSRGTPMARMRDKDARVIHVFNAAR